MAAAAEQPGEGGAPPPPPPRVHRPSSTAVAAAAAVARTAAHAAAVFGQRGDWRPGPVTVNEVVVGPQPPLIPYTEEALDALRDRHMPALMDIVIEGRVTAAVVRYMAERLERRTDLWVYVARSGVQPHTRGAAAIAAAARVRSIEDLPPPVFCGCTSSLPWLLRHWDERERGDRPEVEFIDEVLMPVHPRNMAGRPRRPRRGAAARAPPPPPRPVPAPTLLAVLHMPAKEALDHHLHTELARSVRNDLRANMASDARWVERVLALARAHGTRLWLSGDLMDDASVSYVPALRTALAMRAAGAGAPAMPAVTWVDARLRTSAAFVEACGPLYRPPRHPARATEWLVACAKRA